MPPSSRLRGPRCGDPAPGERRNRPGRRDSPSESRSREGRPALQLAPDGAGLPPGSTIEKTGPRRFRLRWVDEGRPREADELIEVDAVDLAWALTLPLPALVASFRAPDGPATGAS